MSDPQCESVNDVRDPRGGETPASFDHKRFLQTVTTKTGVYRMLDQSGDILYVGKANNLRNRLQSYFRSSGLAPKTQSLVRQIANVEVTVTETEAEALLLESNLIKSHRPRYNVLLRDDKSYPDIALSAHAFPQIRLHRGARRSGTRYFGPYPSAGAVRATLSLLQRVFLLRSCEDSVFKHRTRPCLEHQIGRCSAPCVGLIDQARYAEDVRDAVMFLEGKSQTVIDQRVHRMEAAAANLDFEAAARYRDQIQLLRRVVEQDHISGTEGDCDVLACASRGGIACVQIFWIRNGQNLGNKALFPDLPGHLEPAEILGALLPQYYLHGGHNGIPSQILLSHLPGDAELLATALSETAGQRVQLVSRVRGTRARYLKLAMANAESALNTRVAGRTNEATRLADLARILELGEVPTRIECFDISHTRGEETVAACVVHGTDGPVKSDYRRYNIREVAAGDDYGAMRQALTRRFRRAAEAPEKVPQVLLIDGGRGQVRQASEVLAELDLVDRSVVFGIAKGAGRRPALDTLITSAGQELAVPADAPGRLLLQQIRDEAHRFALTGHRQRRAKARRQSELEEIPGLGPKRRAELLRAFGGINGVKRASIDDMRRIKGVGPQLAEQIYGHLHGDGK